MDRDLAIFLLIGICLVNGIFSPFVFVIWAFAPAWYPDLLPFSPDLAFYLATLASAMLTLMLSGVAAALFERITGRTETDETSVWVWFAAAAVLSLPALEGLAGIA